MTNSSSSLSPTYFKLPTPPNYPYLNVNRISRKHPKNKEEEKRTNSRLTLTLLCGPSTTPRLNLKVWSSCQVRHSWIGNKTEISQKMSLLNQNTTRKTHRMLVQGVNNKILKQIYWDVQKIYCDRVCLRRVSILFNCFDHHPFIT